jgi:hypothetical protein
MKAAQFNDVWVYCASTEMVEVYEDAMQEVDPEYLEESDIRGYLLVMADLRDLARSKVRPFVCVILGPWFSVNGSLNFGSANFNPNDYCTLAQLDSIGVLFNMMPAAPVDAGLQHRVWVISMHMW